MFKIHGIVFVVSGLLAVVYCASFVGASDDYDETTCPGRCNEQYSPVCGKKGDGVKQIFVNSCHMSMENCHKPSNEVYHSTEFENCPNADAWMDMDI